MKKECNGVSPRSSTDYLDGKKKCGSFWACTVVSRDKCTIKLRVLLDPHSGDRGNLFLGLISPLPVKLAPANFANLKFKYISIKSLKDKCLAFTVLPPQTFLSAHGSYSAQEIW